MTDSIHLGRIAGIRIGAHWSLIVVFALIAFSLSGSLLPAEVPGQPVGAYWTVGLAAALCFFGSLLAHELAHAVLARRAGIEIEGITLWLFGGVARLRADAAGPTAEARIAAIGPATSLAVAALFGVVWYALSSVGAPPLLTAGAGWLAFINALLGVFNLLPALPLDGGRLLRALLWRRSGKLMSATVTAARVGRVLAFLMIAAGIVIFFMGDVLNGIWFAFLGWFLLGASRSEEEGTLVREALAGIRVADAMTPDPVVAPGWITVQEFINSYVLTHRHSTFPVRDFEGKLVGLVTLARLKQVPPEARGTTRVVAVAYPLDQVTTATPNEPLADVVGRLNASVGGRALVFEQGRLVGIVSPSDVARALARSDLRATPSR
jgi:Zn-dependent protease